MVEVSRYRLPKRPGCAAALLAAAVAAPLAAAQTPTAAQGLAPAPAPAWLGGRVTAISENDEYAFRVTVDQHYSNGMRLVWLSDPVDATGAGPLGWSRRLAEAVPGFAATPGTLRVGLALGHSMYTAADTRRVVPAADDRPYAGWLFGTLALINEVPGTTPGAAMAETLEFTIGIVGPSAMGKELQGAWHRMIGYPRARGWDSQIRDEPGFGLAYERLWRVPLAGAADAGNPGTQAGLDVLPHVAAGLGNVATFAAGGAMLRIGRHLADDFGPPRVRPALSGAGARRAGARIAAYAFAGVEARLVGYDLFLDGTMFRDGPSVDRRPAVADALAGIALSWGDLRASFAYHWRGREFETQGRADRFGAFSLGLAF